MSKASQTTGSLIRQERERQALSIEGLSFKAGVSYKTIERIESGTTEPRRATLRVIALALGVDERSLRPELDEAA